MRHPRWPDHRPRRPVRARTTLRSTAGGTLREDHVPLPQPGLRPLLRRGALDRSYPRRDHRRNDGRPDLGTRDARHRPRCRRQHGEEKARGIFLISSRIGVDELVREFIDRSAKKDTLRFSTMGSVDDGKSTLIGRLLYDTKSIYEDHLSTLKADSVRVGTGPELDFALLTDGLKAEREQKITIDVAYRYFSTPKRNFIIADTPGHEQYTRNMATGASTANLAIILIDARYGVLPQSRRHAYIAALLGIPHIVVAVNKMDLVDFRQDVFESIRRAFSGFAGQLPIRDLHFIPISALLGDNVVERSARMPWFEGASLLHYLESVHIGNDNNLTDMRFAVQYVIRPTLDFRGYAGQVTSGVIRKGDPIMALPSGRMTRVASIVTSCSTIVERCAE